MVRRGGDVTAAQSDRAQHAVRYRGVPVRPQGLGTGQGGQAGRLGVGQSAGGQVYPCAQDGHRRLGRDAVQRLAVDGAEDLLRLVELAQVHQGGGERQQRLDIARIGRDPRALARGVTQQRERLADLAGVPADDRAGDQGRRGGTAVMLARVGEDGAGRRAGELVVQPGQGLQVRGRGLVFQVAR